MSIGGGEEGRYSSPLYCSAVDGLIYPVGYERRNVIAKRPATIGVYPSYPSPVHRTVSTVFGSPNHQHYHHHHRWDSAMNIRDLRTPTLSSSSSFICAPMKCTRSESYEILPTRSNYPRIRVEARQFCGLGPIYEHRTAAMCEIPSFRPPIPLCR